MPRSGWDLIVVGAGSAGCALAARSAEAGMRVLLLEAGPDYRAAEMDEVWRSPNPIEALLASADSPELVWPGLDATRTETQAPRRYWRGRGVGGSSAINGQIAIRPPVADYDDWAASGCTGWAWDDVLPYFRRLETDVEFGARPYHGDSGPTPVWRMPRAAWGAVDEVLAGAALGLGFNWAEDVNAPGAAGVSPYPINSREGRRVSAADAYLEPTRGLATLTIAGDSLVDRIVLEGGRAVGVEVLQGGRSRIELAAEVVVCAGVIHSPGILMRSGIGPAAALGGLGIDVVADLPVGQGLQEHPTLQINLPLRAEAAIKSNRERHTNCCVRYDSDDPDGSSLDMMLISLNQAVLAMEVAETGEGAGALGVWLNQVHSRGSVALCSRDPHAQPVVKLGMLADERDRRRLRAGARLLAELADGDAARAACRVAASETTPSLWQALDDDEALDRYLFANVVDAQHGTSTARMGPADAATTVVDPECRVLGISGLRVADASIFPSCPRANTNLAAIAIGEKVADQLQKGPR
jgi:choline dehydrogenase